MRKTTIIGIGGVPATGKTTLMKTILGKATDWRVTKPYALLDSVFSVDLGTYVLGKYNPYYEFRGYAEGTDRLSMQVQPSFVKYVDLVRPRRLIFEGDRLFNKSCVTQLMNLENVRVKCFVLAATHEELHRRHEKRGDNQTEKFLASRKTKVSNFLKDDSLAKITQVVTHETENDTEKLVESILKELNAE